MPTVSLIARRPLKYAGRSLAPGAVFEAASSRDAKVLITIGLAHVAPAVTVTLVDAAEPEPETEPAPANKRRYRRRDLTAED